MKIIVLNDEGYFGEKEIEATLRLYGLPEELRGDILGDVLLKTYLEDRTQKSIFEELGLTRARYKSALRTAKTRFFRSESMPNVYLKKVDGEFQKPEDKEIKRYEAMKEICNQLHIEVSENNFSLIESYIEKGIGNFVHLYPSCEKGCFEIYDAVESSKMIALTINGELIGLPELKDQLDKPILFRHYYCFLSDFVDFKEIYELSNRGFYTHTVKFKTRRTIIKKKLIKDHSGRIIGFFSLDGTATIDRDSLKGVYVDGEKIDIQMTKKWTLVDENMAPEMNSVDNQHSSFIRVWPETVHDKLKIIIQEYGLNHPALSKVNKTMLEGAKSFVDGDAQAGNFFAANKVSEILLKSGANRSKFRYNPYADDIL